MSEKQRSAMPAERTAELALEHLLGMLEDPLAYGPGSAIARKRIRELGLKLIAMCRPEGADVRPSSDVDVKCRASSSDPDAA